MKNKIRLTVGGIQYSIVSEENEEYLIKLGQELERRLDYFAKKNPFLSTTMVAVLAALEGYDNAKKLRAENEELHREIDGLLEELAIARSDAFSASRKLNEIIEDNEEQDDDTL